MSLDKEVLLSTKKRDGRGKKDSKRIRAEGLVPVTVYGGDKEATSTTIVKREFAALIRAHGPNGIIYLKYGNTKTPVKIVELQTDPVKGTLLHVDLMRISLTEKTTFDLPVRLIGEPIGVRSFSGILDFVTHMLSIRCLPLDLPDGVDVDVTHLEIGHHISVKDLDLDEKIEVLNEPDTVICTVAPPRVIEEPVAAEAAVEGEELEEPEVIKKGKAEVEEAEEGE